jgi:plastocyanin
MRAVVLLAPLLVAAAACGGGSSSTGATTSGSCPKGAAVVHMRDIRFDPETARVAVGQKVCWVNDDDVQHDARAEDGAFRSALFGNGGTYTTTLRKPGRVAYVCSVHPGMTGTLDVSP